MQQVHACKSSANDNDINVDIKFLSHETDASPPLYLRVRGPRAILWCAREP